ncbi:MAG: bifunctional DNA-formamidopyrimidine glycosylase/DNA-(apurinic or apyrimidinic site) lyase [Actinomycetales bacterium]|nr:bifunctional DNA-formamidopyrimidine glycosylase/DNA-(apurinic or apyrimidinic site) lyase [Actinomycetales bacterium]
MPELPEVEVVRRGLDPYVSGRRIAAVDVLHARAVRRHRAGSRDLSDALTGQRIRCVSRRGKYLWMPLDDGALVAHLGMSGQLLLPAVGTDTDPHLRVRVRFDRGDRQMWFVDQRTFGGLHLDDLVPDGQGGFVPASIAHIARDPLDPAFDDEAFTRALRRKDSGIKRCLLDQSLVSGIGNIYADEALWRARIHYDRPARQMTRAQVTELLGHAREVMTAALAQGGTSFDSLYVNVNGESGWFDRSLDAYGREGEPCRRCGRPLVREAFMNRSSYRCPACQRRPRRTSAN